MRCTKPVTRVIAVALALPLAGAAVADIQFLGSAQAGMAGAGLALPMFWNSESANPALFSYSPKTFFYQLPGIQIFTKNISFSDLRNNFGTVSGGGLDTSKLSTFAQTFGDSDKQFGLAADVGIGFNGFAIGASGGALVRTHPNATLQADVKSGAALQNYNPNDSLDGYGYGYYSIDFAYGHQIPYSKNPDDPRLSAGARVRVIKSYFAHEFVTGDQIISGDTSSTLAPEMMGSQSLTSSGVGADAGMHVAFGKDRNYYAALQVRNLVQPKVGFRATLPQDQTLGVIGETSINPFATMYDFGMGATLCKKVNVAVDAIDIGNSGNSEELRAGVDYDITKIISVQGGYSSRNGWAAGIGFWGFTVAVSSQIPITLTYAFKF